MKKWRSHFKTFFLLVATKVNLVPGNFNAAIGFVVFLKEFQMMMLLLHDSLLKSQMLVLLLCHSLLLVLSRPILDDSNTAKGWVCACNDEQIGTDGAAIVHRLLPINASMDPHALRRSEETHCLWKHELSISTS